MKNNKKILFVVSFTFIFSIFSYCGDYDDIANDLLKGLNPNINLAVVGFGYQVYNSKSRTTSIISERLVTALLKNKEMQNKKIKLIERNLIEKVLQEQKLSQTGIIDIESAPKIGKILSANVIITGNIYDVDYENVEVNVKAIDVEKGTVYSSSNKKLERNWLDLLPEDINTKKPTKAYEYCYLAIKEMDKENFDNAIDLFTRAIKEDITGECGTGKKGFAYFGRAKSYSYNKNLKKYLINHKKAIEDLNLYIEIDNKNPEVYFYRGREYFYIGKYNNKVIDDYDKAIELDPTGQCGTQRKGTAYNYRGFLHYLKWNRLKDNKEKSNNNSEIDEVKKEYDKMIYDWSKAIEVNPTFKPFYFILKNAYVGGGEYDKAIETLNKLIELYPDYIDAYSQRGEIYLYLKEYDKANKDFNKAIEEINKEIEINPNNEESYRKRAEIYFNLNEYNKALADITKTIELKPNNSNNYEYRTYIYFALKEYDKAIKDISKAIELNPNSFEYYKVRGNIYEKMGLKEEAQKDFEKFRNILNSHSLFKKQKEN